MTTIFLAAVSPAIGCVSGELFQLTREHDVASILVWSLAISVWHFSVVIRIICFMTIQDQPTAPQLFSIIKAD